VNLGGVAAEIDQGGSRADGGKWPTSAASAPTKP
jgi:hypothetical protein